MKYHPKCRPPRGAVDVLRLGDDGRWRADNGQHGRAFLGRMEGDADGTAIAWVANCSCPYLNGCPLGKALNQATELGATSTSVQRRRAYHVIPKRHR